MATLKFPSNKEAVMLAVVFPKGGVGKTTTTVNLAGALSKQYPDLRILVVETDDRGNAATSFNLDSSTFDATSYDIFMGNMTPEETVVKAYKNIDIIASNKDMNYLEFDQLAEYDQRMKDNLWNLLQTEGPKLLEMSREDFNKETTKGINLDSYYFNILAGKFDNLRKQYDVILFDTPAELKAVSSSVLSIVDQMLIPIEPDPFSVDGLSNIVQRVATIRDKYNPKLHIAGVLATKVRARTVLHADVTKDLMRFCMHNNLNYLDTQIPNSIRFASSAGYKGLPATLSGDPKEKFIHNYFQLANELISNGSFTSQN
ncbi:ParA family protein [Furfurilactobacillus entadae]|uniref:ParA family protein n=1 Tax=Furfurilactobacillus entadae TaxID=2922307 RepID=UPI0035E8DB11